MKYTKKLIIVLYVLIIVCIGGATVVEKFRGTSFVSDYIYGAWWFSALWAVLTVAACAYLVQQRLYKRFAVLLLHLSFVVILAGALTTHLFARRGTVRLRTDVPEIAFVDKDSRVEHFPFALTLKEFRVVNYPGTDAPLDYQSRLSFKVMWTPAEEGEVLVSMNHIGHIEGYRLFQQSYDSDGEGVTLGVSYDPYGIAITYLGYLLLLVGIIATLLSRQIQMRSLYRKAIAMVLFLVSVSANAANSQQSTPQLPSVDADIAHRMGTIPVLYNSRICPLNTVATDFVMKMTGRASWQGYSADEVFFSWMIYYMPWEQELLLGNPKQKGAEERKAVVEMFYNGQFTKIFPARLSQTGVLDDSLAESQITWYAPGSQVLPREIPVKEQFFIKQSMDFLTEAIVTGQRERVFEIIAKIKLFQHDMAGDVLPDSRVLKAEIFYNTLRSQKWPVFLALTLSLLLCLIMLLRQHLSAFLRISFFTLQTLLFIYVSLHLGLRWWLSGHIPVSNGHETMLFMAWALLLITFFLRRKFPIIMGFGPLIASFCLLVSVLAGTSSQLTPLMPVLQSPLLSIHVMTVMCAYALFALQVLLGLQALLLMRKRDQVAQLDRITALSQFLLYPAVFLLAIGIFLGAVWANVSWGNYWSWDPKESWALITLLVYAVPMHKASIGQFRQPRVYHIYIVAAFLAVLITYFGVNFLLGGMHSYA